MIFNCIICSCENVCTLLKNELKNRVLDIYFNPKKKKNSRFLIIWTSFRKMVPHFYVKSKRAFHARLKKLHKVFFKNCKKNTPADNAKYLRIIINIWTS